MRITPLSDVLGAAIEGIDLSGPVPPGDFAALEAALHGHGFIVFPGQTLDPGELVAFARLWGPPQPHVIDTHHHPVDANILVLSNVQRAGSPVGLADAGTYFHTDYSYLEVPARVTILHAIQRHPVARPHPRTGRKALYAVSGSSFAIDGMEEADARCLLDELKAHATQPRYCHTYDYRIGDVIVWDNAQLLHSAPLADPGDPRTLWRVTVTETA